MDLWIRSQDREIICKAECVDLMHDTEGYAKVFLNGNFPDLIVAVYENKRALEVLDEIQTLLLGDVLLFKSFNVNSEDLSEIGNQLKTKVLGMVDVNNPDTEIKFIPRDCIVYEMPKE